MNKGSLLIWLIPLLVILVVVGCARDPLVRHKKLTNFFDGVPDLPPLDQLCEDNMEDLFNTYYEERLAEASAGSIEEKKVVTAKGSSHPPYAQKRCEGCHNFKNKNLLIAPKDELCEKCHTDFVSSKGKNIHGPVAVRDCLACHLPHSSGNKALLQESLSAICDKCHQEERLAGRMHEQVMAHDMDCVNCHDAHGGDARYFLQ